VAENRFRCEDLTGKRYGKLVVEKFSYQSKTRANYWECRCDCGNNIVERGSHLKSGFVRSCGCFVEDTELENSILPQIKLGQEVRFAPFEPFTGFGADASRGKLVTGTVVYVNYRHGWFSVEYDCGGTKQRTSFHFDEIGEEVKICGHKKNR
jgi:hypothetical protein